MVGKRPISKIYFLTMGARRGAELERRPVRGVHTGLAETQHLIHDPQNSRSPSRSGLVGLAGPEEAFEGWISGLRFMEILSRDPRFAT